MKEIIIVTKQGFVKRIPLDWIRVMGRTAKGLRIIKLYNEDEVIAATVVTGINETGSKSQGEESENNLGAKKIPEAPIELSELPIEKGSTATGIDNQGF